LGDLESASFLYHNNFLFVFYCITYGDDRQSSVELICDESEGKGRFEYVGMNLNCTLDVLVLGNVHLHKMNVKLRICVVVKCQMELAQLTFDIPLMIQQIHLEMK